MILETNIFLVCVFCFFTFSPPALLNLDGPGDLGNAVHQAGAPSEGKIVMGSGGIIWNQ